VSVGASVAVVAALVGAQAPAKREPVDLLLSGGIVLTMDASFTVHNPGAIAVKDGKIVAVGTASDVASRFAPRARYDATAKILMPGMVNAHTHAAMSLLRGLAEDMPLERWLTENIFPAEAKNVSPDFVYEGTLLAALEMIKGGTTCFADMYYFMSDAARAVDKAGLRAVLGETFIDFPVPDHKDLPETLKFMDGFVAKWKAHPRITPAVAPHSVYTCSTETLTAARDVAHKANIPILIHVAETCREVAESRQKWGKSSVFRLAEIGFFDPSKDGRKVPILANHAICVDEKDRALLKQYGVATSHNPESNMKLASGIAPVAEMEKEGVLWALGTDGPAGSNNDVSMFDAMDFAGKLAKVTTMDPTVLPSREIVAAATRDGARALGMESRIGSLEPGKQADIIAIDTRRAHMQPFEDPFSAIVYSTDDDDVTDVWVDGRQLLAGGVAKTINETEVLQAAARWRARVRTSLSQPKAPAGEKP
jgi:5-methylthioadenosine/S-adenosylhomocysteine deaminase